MRINFHPESDHCLPRLLTHCCFRDFVQVTLADAEDSKVVVAITHFENDVQQLAVAL